MRLALIARENGIRIAAPISGWASIKYWCGATVTRGVMVSNSATRPESTAKLVLSASLKMGIGR